MTEPRKAVSSFDFGGKLARALGLHSTRHIELIVPFNDVVIVRVEYQPTQEELDRVLTVIEDAQVQSPFSGWPSPERGGR